MSTRGPTIVSESGFITPEDAILVTSFSNVESGTHHTSILNAATQFRMYIIGSLPEWLPIRPAESAMTVAMRESERETATRTPVGYRVAEAENSLAAGMAAVR